MHNGRPRFVERMGLGLNLVQLVALIRDTLEVGLAYRCQSSAADDRFQRCCHLIVIRQ